MLFLPEKAPTIVPDTERPALIDGLRRERAAQTYADTTLNRVIIRLGDILPLAADDKHGYPRRLR